MWKVKKETRQKQRKFFTHLVIFMSISACLSRLYIMIGAKVCFYFEDKTSSRFRPYTLNSAGTNQCKTTKLIILSSYLIRKIEGKACLLYIQCRSGWMWRHFTHRPLDGALSQVNAAFLLSLHHSHFTLLLSMPMHAPHTPNHYDLCKSVMNNVFPFKRPELSSQAFCPPIHGKLLCRTVSSAGCVRPLSGHEQRQQIRQVDVVKASDCS